MSEWSSQSSTLGPNRISGLLRQRYIGACSAAAVLDAYGGGIVLPKDLSCGVVEGIGYRWYVVRKGVLLWCVVKRS